ncbi:lipoprotein [Paenibacillus lentus]|uniref:LptM family lipoprotein n=1 Tax=Paenibacillus lentus TaxID=1338368 RepID=UPI001FEAAE54|nr:hypothetical protein [Paenibacillus lentus]
MKKIILILPLLVTAGLLQGCGQKVAGEQAGSFAAVVNTQRHARVEKQPSPELKSESVSSVEEEEEEATNEPSVDNPTDGIPERPQDKVTGDKTEPSTNKSEADPTHVPSAQASTENVKKSTEQDTESTDSTAAKVKKLEKEKEKEKEDKLQAVEEKTTSGPERVGWSEFFDGEDQTTPSERFWDLSGSTVTIKGFMGEVLSFEKNWFLLIPEPGAECPFDNGDESYWNKIMIVFVPDDVKLRYKPEPLQITGRLDVGIKIDESGYKTMFRLYDATFKEINS